MNCYIYFPAKMVKFEYIYPEDVEITSSTGIVLNTSDTLHCTQSSLSRST